MTYQLAYPEPMSLPVVHLHTLAGASPHKGTGIDPSTEKKGLLSLIYIYIIYFLQTIFISHPISCHSTEHPTSQKKRLKQQSHL